RVVLSDFANGQRKCTAETEFREHDELAKLIGIATSVDKGAKFVDATQVGCAKRCRRNAVVLSNMELGEPAPFAEQFGFSDVHASYELSALIFDRTFPANGNVDSVRQVLLLEDKLKLTQLLRSR